MYIINSADSVINDQRRVYNILQTESNSDLYLSPQFFFRSVCCKFGNKELHFSLN